MSRQRKPIPGVDPKLLIRDAAKLLPDRRDVCSCAAPRVSARSPSLTGCDIIDGDRGECAARHFEFQRLGQARLFNPNTLAPEYPESAITRPFPFNAYYTEDDAPDVDGENYQARDRRPGRQQEAVDACPS